MLNLIVNKIKLKIKLFYKNRVIMVLGVVYMATISARINEALSIRNMKPIDLARATGIPKASISQYMSGYVEPKQNRIYLISKALNVREAWLMGYDVPMNRMDNIEDNFDTKDEDTSIKNELIQIINNMNANQLNTLLGMANVLIKNGGEQ